MSTEHTPGTMRVEPLSPRDTWPVLKIGRCHRCIRVGSQAERSRDGRAARQRRPVSP